MVVPVRRSIVPSLPLPPVEAGVRADLRDELFADGLTNLPDTEGTVPRHRFTNTFTSLGPSVSRSTPPCTFVS
jgi:hypothetical protein